MEKTYRRGGFFFIEAVNGFNAIFEQYRRRFRHLFGVDGSTRQNTFGKNPFAELQKLIDSFTEWESVVEKDKFMSLYDFFYKIDKAIERNTKQKEKR